MLPLLIGVRDDAKIVDVTIKILLNLTVPVECLLPMEVMLKTDVGRYTVMELNMLLSTSKEAFVSPQSTRPVVDHIKTILEKESKLTPEDCESISNCLLLLRNILHIPEHRPAGNGASMQNQILWNLFAQNVDKVLIQLMTSKYQAYFGVTMVQLIALMYKDQQVGTLQKLLNLWFESSLSDSSEGNESNTSPQHQASGDSSSLMTSDPTSDSSDNGGSNKKRNPYQSGDSKCVNNESDDSQSSETGISSSPSSAALQSTGQSTPMDSDHQNQHQVRLTHPPMGKVRVKSLSELQTRPRRIEKHGDAENSLADDSVPSTAGHSGSRSRHSLQKATLTQSSGFSSQSLSSDSFSHGKHHNHSQDAFGKMYEPLAKSQDCKLHKDSHPKLHQPHGSGHSAGNPSKPPGKKGESGSEVSDCGYGTQQENQESNSTSSNEEDAPQRVKHQKPQHMLQKSRYINGKPNITPQERKELHRKKLVKRSHTNTMHMKALLHHVPSDEDVSNLLKEFTVDFLLRGYACLVKVLHNCLLDGGPVQMDTSHFFWLVTYFLKFATQLELDLEHISSSVLTIDIVSYLTYEGVNLYEELQMSIQSSGRDLKPCLRRMHLVVTSIREFIQAVEAYKKITHLTEEDRNHLLKLQLQIAEVHDLRGLFVLLLRHYNPTLQSHQFLQDLVVTNHNLLMFVESTVKLPEFQANVNLVQHIKQFGTIEVMRNYGLLLEDFLNNGEFVNDCILTMMHHVAGDLSQVAVLFQPSILCSLSGIWESDYELCDDWSDLIEYVLHKFVRNPSCSKANSSMQAEGRHISPISEANKTEWTKEDSNNLYWYYQQCSSCEDPIEAIINMFENSGVHDKTRISVIQQLLQQDVINERQYDSYMERETMHAMSEKRRFPVYSTQKSARLENAARGGSDEQQNQNQTEEMEQDSVVAANDIQALKDQLESEGHGQMIIWLQELLLEVCYVKLSLETNLPAVKEPIAHIYTRLHQSTPLVPWYTEQEQCLHYPTFILLLHKLGFHLAGDAGRLFPRIPQFWATDVLFQTAEKLGSINEGNLKFDASLCKSGAGYGQADILAPLNRLSMDFTNSNSQGNSFTENSFFTPSGASKTSLSLSRFTPEPVMYNMPNWLQVVQQCRASRQAPLSETSKCSVGMKEKTPIFSLCLPSSPSLTKNNQDLPSFEHESSNDQLQPDVLEMSKSFEPIEEINQETSDMDTSI